MDTTEERAYLAWLGYDVDNMSDVEIFSALERLYSIWESD